MVKKINISVQEKDLKKIDDYCKIHNLTRSQFMVECSIEKTFIEDMANGFIILNKYLGKLDYNKVLEEGDRKLLEHAMELFNGLRR